MDDKRFPIIIPVKASDYSRIKRDLSVFFTLLNAAELVFIGSGELEDLVKRDSKDLPEEYKVSFLNELELLDFNRVAAAVRGRLADEGYDMSENSRPGWYYQQFLKMEYSRVCEYEYYMSWDADTIPVRKVSMFSEGGKPFFDLKSEYNEGYFRTIEKLLGLKKIIEQSFISEHMIFSKSRMQELINEIEQTPFKGEKYYEKIFYSLDLDNLKLGFSEFETYGTWMLSRHPEDCELRIWKSIRKAAIFINPDELTEDDLNWIADSYDAITFETYHPYSEDLGKIFKNPSHREKLSAEMFYQIIIDKFLTGGPY